MLGKPRNTHWNVQSPVIPNKSIVDQIPSISTTSSSLNSLFRVLFIFPSRYLFAIGLSSMFSLRWSIPPLFKLHSQATWLLTECVLVRPHSASAYGSLTLSAVLFQACFTIFKLPQGNYQCLLRTPQLITLHLCAAFPQHKFSAWAFVSFLFIRHY